MTELQNTAVYSEPRIDTEAAKKTVKRVLKKILTYVPTVIVIGLIALYYIQLSHMA